MHFFVYPRSPSLHSLSLLLVSTLAMVALVVGFAVGVVTGLASRRQQPTILPNITASQVPSNHSVGGEVSAGVTPEYEEISLHEAKDIHLTGNAAYNMDARLYINLVFCCCCCFHVVMLFFCMYFKNQYCCCVSSILAIHLIPSMPTFPPPLL